MSSSKLEIYLRHQWYVRIAHPFVLKTNNCLHLGHKPITNHKSGTDFSWPWVEPVYIGDQEQIDVSGWVPQEGVFRKYKCKTSPSLLNITGDFHKINQTLWFLQLCLVTQCSSVCRHWNVDFRRPITYQHSWQMSGRSLSLRHAAELRTMEGHKRSCCTVDLRIQGGTIWEEESFCKDSFESVSTAL